MFGKTETLFLKFKLKIINGIKQSYKLMKEYQMLGFYLSGHPLESYKNDFDTLNLKSFETYKKILIT